MIKYCKTYTPNKNKILKLISESIKSGCLTNNGPLVCKLEDSLSEYLNVKNVICVSNGTIAIQLVIKALGLSGDILTTPFTFVATSSSIIWESCNPVFSDINFENLNIDIQGIEEKITPKTSAIIPVHTFGNICDVDSFDIIAKKNNLKLIYDAAHAFGVKYKNSSILKYGDASTLSFHATKVFHTVEGGAIITEDNYLAQELRKIRSFGMSENIIGINAKMSEINAAFGIVALENFDNIIELRECIANLYDENIDYNFLRPKSNPLATKNFGYYPIIFQSNEARDLAYNNLLENNIESKKYFSPSLDAILKTQYCRYSNQAVDRILCIPIYPGLKKKDALKICKIINKHKNI